DHLPDCARRSLLAAQRADIDRRAELGLEVLLEPVEHAALELARALAADLVAVADLLQREGLFGEPALAEDRLLAALERPRERLELAAQQLGKFALRDRAIGAFVLARQVVEPRPRALVVAAAADRGIQGRLG